MKLNDLSSEIINAAITVHRELGPGLLESVYKSCMILEMFSREIKVESELTVPVFYGSSTFQVGSSDLKFSLPAMM